MMHVLLKQRSDHARMRAIVQSVVDKEKGVEAFDDYMKAVFPWLENAKAKDRAGHMKKLMDEVRRGPLNVTPMAMPRKATSRIKEKINRKNPPTAAEMNRLYDRLGRKVPQ